MRHPEDRLVSRIRDDGGEREFPTETHSSPEGMASAGYEVVNRRRLPFKAMSPRATRVHDDTPMDPNVETEWGQRSYDRVADDFNKDGNIDDPVPCVGRPSRSRQ